MAARFNADGSLLVLAAERRISIYRTEPFSLQFAVESPVELCSARILDSSNVLLLQPQSTLEKLYLYDFKRLKLAHFNLGMDLVDAFVSKQLVLTVFRTCAVLFAVESQRRLIRVELGQEAEFPTAFAGLYASTFAVPHGKRGSIMVGQVMPDYTVETRVYKVHKSRVASLALNSRFLASSSVTGTLIRCVNLESGEQLVFRRGADQQRVWSLAFSPTHFLAALSGNGTLHVYDLDAIEKSFVKRRYNRDGRHTAHIMTASKDSAQLAWVSDSLILLARDGIVETFTYDGSLHRGTVYPLRAHDAYS